MIKGLDKFQTHFKVDHKSFVVIGGVACHEWFASKGLEFRATKDIDVVIIIEAVDQTFVKRLWEFIEAGKYECREKDGDRELHRFSKPKEDGYPFMLELFSRKAANIDLSAGQEVVPVRKEAGSISLSAILLDDEYYKLILESRQEGEVPYVNPSALIPLKAKAWLDLTKRKSSGEDIDSKDIAKHRNDVFRIAATLPGEAGPDIGKTVASDLQSFLSAFPPENPEWDGILMSLKGSFGGTKLNPKDVITSIFTYFKLADSQATDIQK
jgi:hypothetical protein